MIPEEQAKVEISVGLGEQPPLEKPCYSYYPCYSQEKTDDSKPIDERNNEGNKNNNNNKGNKGNKSNSVTTTTHNKNTTIQIDNPIKSPDDIPKWVQAEGQWPTVQYILYHQQSGYQELAMLMKTSIPVVKNLLSHHPDECLMLREGHAVIISLQDPKKIEVKNWIEAERIIQEKKLEEAQQAERDYQTRIIKEQTIHDRVDAFFWARAKKELNKLGASYPLKRSACIKYADLEEIGADFMNDFEQDAKACLKLLNDCLHEALQPFPFNKPPATLEDLHDIEVRISEIPEEVMQTIEKINSFAVNKFCAFEGIVQMATEVKPKIKKAVFRCKRCDTETTLLLEDEEMKVPIVCDTCGRPNAFELVESRCHYVDWCKIQFQEPLEITRDTANPPKIVGWVEGDETLTVSVGRRYKVSGVLETRKTKETARAVRVKMLRINHIEPVEKEDEVEVTEEERKKIEKFAKDPHLYDSIIPDSWAPTVYGYKEAKTGAFLNVVGGNDTINPLDKSANRASIHLIYIGEPGVAKSKLAKYTQQVERKSIYTTGGGTTAGGLTAIAEKSDFGEGGWVIKAGALPTASGGTVIIDEFDKTPPEIKASIHEAMEQQSISISKAGISTQFVAKTNVFAIANPKYSRFDLNKPFIEQFNLQPALLSRFDLIFVIRDIVSEEKDTAVADTILNNRQNSITGKIQKDIIPPELMMKYLMLAKKKVPKMPESSMKKLTKYYIDIRKRSTADSLTITPRQLEAIARISEAFAKGRLADEVSEDDIKRAITLMEYTLKEICPSDSGSFNIDYIMADYTAADRDNFFKIIHIISELEKEWEMVSIEKIAKEAIAHNMSSADVEKYIKELNDKGDIYSPRSGYWKVVKR